MPTGATVALKGCGVIDFFGAMHLSRAWVTGKGLILLMPGLSDEASLFLQTDARSFYGRPASDVETPNFPL